MLEDRRWDGQIERQIERRIDAKTEGQTGRLRDARMHLKCSITMAYLNVIYTILIQFFLISYREKTTTKKIKGQLSY